MLAYVLRTKVLCKAAEIAATRSLNAQLFLRHATFKALYKKRSHLLRLLHHDHFTDMHHRSPYKLTYLQWVKVVDLSFLFYFILFYVVVLNRWYRYCIQCKHNNKIHSYIQSLDPIKNFKI